jgi:hypothetical protein
MSMSTHSGRLLHTRRTNGPLRLQRVFSPLPPIAGSSGSGACVPQGVGTATDPTVGIKAIGLMPPHNSHSLKTFVYGNFFFFRLLWLYKNWSDAGHISILNRMTGVFEVVLCETHGEFLVCKGARALERRFIPILRHFTSYPKRPLLYIYIDLYGLALSALASCEQAWRTVSCIFFAIRGATTYCYVGLFVERPRSVRQTRCKVIWDQLHRRNGSRRGGPYVQLEVKDQSNQFNPC